MNGIIYLAINSKKEYTLGYSREPELKKQGLSVPNDFAVIHTIPTNQVYEAYRYLNLLLAPYFTGEGILSLPDREMKMLTNLAKLEY